MPGTTIAFISDLHIDDEVSAGANAYPRPNLEKVLADIKRRNVSHIIIGGDLGDASALPWLFDQLKDFRVEFILGNHDHYAAAAPFLLQHSGKQNELFYSFDEDDYRYIFLDSSSETVSDAQLDWLPQQLATELQILIFIHHPVLRINSAVDSLYPLKNRQSIEAVLRQSEKSISLFCGHCHTADFKTDGNIRQYVTPSISFQAQQSTADLQFDNSRFGYSIIELGDSVELNVVWFNV
ncbi:MAG: metallophosphoesterase family protein [Flavisolibacter sp.]